MTSFYRVYDCTVDRPCSIFECSSDAVAIKAFYAMYPVDSINEYALYRLCNCSTDGLTVTQDFQLVIQGKSNSELDKDDDDVSAD